MKDENILQKNTKNFKVEGEIISIKPLLDGHINDTFIVDTETKKNTFCKRKTKKFFKMYLQ